MDNRLKRPATFNIGHADHDIALLSADQILTVQFDFDKLKHLLIQIMGDIRVHEEKIAHVHGHISKSEASNNDVNKKIHAIQDSIKEEAKKHQGTMDAIKGLEERIKETTDSLDKRMEETEDLLKKEAEVKGNQIQEIKLSIEQLINQQQQQQEEEQEEEELQDEEENEGSEIQEPFGSKSSIERKNSETKLLIIEPPSDEQHNNKYNDDQVVATPKDSLISHILSGDSEEDEEEEQKLGQLPNPSKKTFKNNRRDSVMPRASVNLLTAQKVSEIQRKATSSMKVDEENNSINGIRLAAKKVMNPPAPAVSIQSPITTRSTFKKMNTMSKNGAIPGNITHQVEAISQEIKDEIQSLKDLIEDMKNEISDVNTSSKQGERALNTKIIDYIRNTEKGNGERQDIIEKQAANFEKLRTQVTDGLKQGQIEQMNKHIRVIEKDMEIFKSASSQFIEVNQKIDAIEGKNTELLLQMKEVQEQVSHNLKTVQSNEPLPGEGKHADIIVRDLKISLTKKILSLKTDVDDQFARNSTEILEAKMIQRMNDVVVVLTREMADRNDTKKNFKIVDKMIKNLFQIVTYGLRKQGILTSKVIKEAKKLNIFLSIEYILNYFSNDQAFNSIERNGERCVVIGDEISPKKHLEIGGIQSEDKPSQVRLCLKRHSHDNSQPPIVIPGEQSQQKGKWQQTLSQQIIIPVNNGVQVKNMRATNNSSSTQRSFNLGESYDSRGKIHVKAHINLEDSSIEGPALIQNNPVQSSVPSSRRQRTISMIPSQNNNQTYGRPNTQNNCTGRQMFQFKSRQQMFQLGAVNNSIESAEEDLQKIHAVLNKGPSNSKIAQRFKHVNIIDYHSNNMGTSTEDITEQAGLNPLRSARNTDQFANTSIISQMKHESTKAITKDHLIQPLLSARLPMSPMSQKQFLRLRR